MRVLQNFETKIWGETFSHVLQLPLANILENYLIPKPNQLMQNTNTGNLKKKKCKRTSPYCVHQHIHTQAWMRHGARERQASIHEIIYEQYTTLSRSLFQTHFRPSGPQVLILNVTLVQLTLSFLPFFCFSLFLPLIQHFITQ